MRVDETHHMKYGSYITHFGEANINDLIIKYRSSTSALFVNALKINHQAICPALRRFNLYPKSKIMKNRLRKVVNFFAFNLLFFALYLNFIHKDNSNEVAKVGTAAPAYTGTQPVDANGNVTKPQAEMAKK